MQPESPLTEKEAALLFARAWNLLSSEPLEPFLNELTVYESQMVLVPMTGGEEILAYLAGKFETLSRDPAYQPYFELGRLHGIRPCVIMCQGSKDNPLALALFEVEGRSIRRIDICIAPAPAEAERTGIFPGLATG